MSTRKPSRKLTVAKRRELEVSAALAREAITQFHVNSAISMIELAAGRAARLADPRVRRDLMTTAAAGYTGVLALLTWQALRGPPLVAPDALTVAAAGVLTVLVVAGAVVALRERRPVLTPGR